MSSTVLPGGLVGIEKLGGAWQSGFSFLSVVDSKGVGRRCVVLVGHRRLAYVGHVEGRGVF